ncbi:DUF2510 domain-containing protein [Planococcus sp. APC 4015]|nr:DUF2510 domain-containing protein [Planococcus sp. APC 4015]
MSTPAGWYPDPSTPGVQRYWDGQAWSAGVAGHRSPYELKAPAGTDPNTVWIWLVVLLPLAPMLFALFIPWGSLFEFDPYATDPSAAMQASLAPYTSPVFILSNVVSYAVYGLCIFFAYRDHRELLARGVPRPFHWAWAFLNPVYSIGRSVVVKRRTGRGLGPLWVAIATMVLSVVVAIVISVVAFAAVFDMMRTMPGMPGA